MKPTGCLASFLTTTFLFLHVDGFRNIVAFGDSMTDSCQFGAKYTVDQALNSTKVRNLSCATCTFYCAL